MQKSMIYIRYLVGLKIGMVILVVLNVNYMKKAQILFPSVEVPVDVTCTLVQGTQKKRVGHHRIGMEDHALRPEEKGRPFFPKTTMREKKGLQ